MIEVIGWVIVALVTLFFGSIALTGILMFLGMVFGVPLAVIVRTLRK